MGGRACIALLALIGTCATSASAAAADAVPIQRIRIAYEAPAGCPDRVAFGQDLVRRTPRIVLSEERDATAYDVRIAERGGGFEGTLRDVTERTEPHSQRGARCASVASALALTLALAIDPDARLEIAPPPPPPPPPPVAPAPFVEPPGAERVPAPSPRASSRVVAIAAGASTTMAVFDAPLGSLTLALESRSGERGSPVPLWFRIRLALGGQGAPPAGTEARVALGALGFDACAFELAAGAFSLRPCLGVEPGMASAEGRRIRSPQSAAAFWLAASGRLRADVAFAGRFGLGLEGAAVVMLVRPRFVVDPPLRTAAEAGAAGAELALNLWMSFP